jgi:hypothetical protein
MNLHQPAVESERRIQVDGRKAVAILRLMRVTGLSLSLSHERGGRRWVLSNGEHVPDAVARALTTDSNMIGVGDGLFAGVSQTYRYVSDEKRRNPHV